MGRWLFRLFVGLCNQIIEKKISESFAGMKILHTFATAIERYASSVAGSEVLSGSKGWPVRLSVRTQDFHS